MWFYPRALGYDGKGLFLLTRGYGFESSFGHGAMLNLLRKSFAASLYQKNCVVLRLDESEIQSP